MLRPAPFETAASSKFGTVGWYVRLQQSAISSTVTLEPPEEETNPWKPDPGASAEQVTADLQELLRRYSLNPPEVREEDKQYCWQCKCPEKLVIGALCQYCLDHPPQRQNDGWPALGGSPPIL